MGCWNKTCGLSKLHIYAGDPVYVFVMEQQTNHERCYATAFWRPVMVPFEAKYDDYGGAEDFSGVWLNDIIQGIASKLVEMPQGENRYHDIPVAREGFDVDKFFEAVHEGRLFTKDYNGKNAHVDFVMFRKDVVDDILANYEVDKYVGSGKGNRPDADGDNNYIYYKFADVIADVPAFLDRLDSSMRDRITEVKERFTNEETDEAKANEAALHLASFMLFRDLGSVFDWNDTNKAAWYLYRDGYRFSSLVDVSSRIIEATVTGNRAYAEELLTEHLLACFLNAFLECTRGLWQPGCHEGSQASEHAGYRALTAAINRALDEEHKRWDE